MHTTNLSDRGQTELDILLDEAVEQYDVRGVVAEVANRDRTIYRGAFGTRDELRAFDMPADAIFQIKSMTKPITSVAVMILKDQGVIDLDDPVARYLPDIKNAKIISDFDEADGSFTTRPGGHDITLRHLLTHTAGFGYNFSSHILSKLGDRLPAASVLLHEPGSQWTYGSSTYVLGKVIEQVSGEPLDAFFETYIFKPLGMKDTGFDLKQNDYDRFAALFKRVHGRLVWVQLPETYQPQVFGDQGLLSTADDYIRFLRMLLNLGRFEGETLVTEQSVEEMTRNQIGSLTVEEQPGAIPWLSNSFPLGAGKDKFGLGFRLKEGMEVDARSPGSGSWAGLYNTHFWIDPKQGIATVLLMQVLPFYDDRCIRLLTNVEKSIYRNLE